MTKRERALLSHVYARLNEITGLRPPNPADIAAISRNLQVATETAACLSRAVFQILDGNYPEAGTEVTRAQRALEPQEVVAR